MWEARAAKPGTLPASAWLPLLCSSTALFCWARPENIKSHVRARLPSARCPQGDFSTGHTCERWKSDYHCRQVSGGVASCFFPQNAPSCCQGEPRRLRITSGLTPSASTDTRNQPQQTRRNVSNGVWVLYKSLKPDPSRVAFLACICTCNLKISAE